MSKVNFPRIVRFPEVIKITGWSKSTIYNRLKVGLFPKPVSLGARSVGFVESELQEYMHAVIAGLSDDELRQVARSLSAQRFKLYQTKIR
ncbi:helix-turn-helix transcriptional regulator [Pseudidiomarina taiwanensis]|uniref:Transcriptional regulator n=1 Tax=Pseudidiomarina taiwanensis TaxID=337250 RepID=A0A432ZMI2_9GAMM|nr:AlpA family phage regulatory protein [Pseudidiomarina taiwanensis]RUO79099.1 transcriptional regulator [Pseudidiomarina taiwanensis]